MAAYATRDDLELTFGVDNIAKWADASNNEDDDEITARCTWALNKATNYINDRLRRSIYSVPFDDAPQSIVDLCASMAGMILYKSPRGLIDGEDAQAAMKTIDDENEMRIRQILAGHLDLDVEQTYSNHPEPINDDYGEE